MFINVFIVSKNDFSYNRICLKFIHIECLSSYKIRNFINLAFFYIDFEYV